VETPSEDPFLCGVYGAMHTLGLQNNSQLDDRYFQAVATLKHFDANSLEGPHWTLDGTWDPKNGTVSRHSFNAKISLHDLAMSYLPAFRQSVVEGGAAGVMCSYNSINGVPTCANEYLLQQVLRRDWKFRGYVTSDSEALTDIVQHHNYAKDMLEMVPLALHAGCDIESAGWKSGHPHATGGEYITHIPEAVQKELLDESLVDRALRNALGIRFRLGLFDPIDDQPFWKVKPSVVRSDNHVQMAKEATAQGLVLLKNDGNLLPLKLDAATKIALIGPHINNRKEMAGNYLGELCSGSNYDCITSFAEGFSNATAKYGGTLLTETGCEVNGTDTSGFSKAKDAASEADIVIFVGVWTGPWKRKTETGLIFASLPSKAH
jgi:xylan 1,4-beta-xylosidase